MSVGPPTLQSATPMIPGRNPNNFRKNFSCPAAAQQGQQAEAAEQRDGGLGDGGVGEDKIVGIRSEGP